VELLKTALQFAKQVLQFSLVETRAGFETAIFTEDEQDLAANAIVRVPKIYSQLVIFNIFSTNFIFMKKDTYGTMF